MWNFLKYWIWKQWISNQDTKCCHCKVVFLSCPSFGLLHSAQIQIFFPMKEAIVTTPYSGWVMLHNPVEIDIFSKKDILILFTQCNSFLKMTGIFTPNDNFFFSLLPKWLNSHDTLNLTNFLFTKWHSCSIKITLDMLINWQQTFLGVMTTAWGKTYTEN